MNIQRLSLALSLALVAGPVLAGGTTGHSGGGGGAVSSGGHHSGGAGGGSSGHHAVPRGSGGGSAAGAQARHPHPGSGHYYGGGYGYGYRGGRYPGFYGGYYPYYYGFYGFDPFFDLYGGYYPYSYSYYPYSYYPYSYYPDSGEGGSSDGAYYGRGSYRSEQAEGAVRLIVDPDKTKVYVDGYYSGVVDDYDGLFQRLYLPAGRHELILRLDGYETQHFKVYVTPDVTLKIHHSMAKGAGDNSKEIVVGDPDMDRFTQLRRDEDKGGYASDDRDDDNDAPPPPSPRRYGMRHSYRDEGASLRLNVTPEDSSVYVDGRFYGTARDSRRLDLAPGRHKVEVVRPGYRTFEKDVEIEAERTQDLDVALER